MMNVEQLQECIGHLTRIGVALTSEHDLDKLLDLIVTEVREFTHADAGSLYIREGDRLRFAASQNKTLGMGIGPQPADAPSFRNLYIPINMQSLAGYVCETGQVLNLVDAYQIPADSPYQFNRGFDQKTGYRTQSMLLVPMRNQQQKVLGVIQLINSTAKDGTVVPFDRDMESLVVCIASQAAVSLDNAQLTKAIKEAHLDTIYRLAIAAEYRDEDTALHLKRMSNYSQIIARHYGMTEERAELVLYASPMHDVGKLGIPDAILLKPGRLTAIEREIMQTHTSIGAKILSGSQSELLEVSRIIALTHHEKFDGTGYPLGLEAEDIPIEGRIVALADVFDALTSRRCYKPAYELEKVMTMIRGDRGKHFDPGVFDAFDRGFQEILEVYNKYRE
ncbi:MAG: GAF domain-containing protein [Candidatus Wallbacteria bacterium]|nr:GAF domain-containing protein [Candidatus Wallbacteria bacterium]